MPGVEKVESVLSYAKENWKEAEKWEMLNEGKTKQIFAIPNHPAHVLVRNKDRITAFNAERKDDMADKGHLSNATNEAIYKYLAEAGVATHFLAAVSERDFVAERCDMIPLEWVTRRLATGSFLKRFPGVEEGTTFAPPKLEICYKDDAAGDPVWSLEQILAKGLQCGGVPIREAEIAQMSHTTVAIFEVLERAWSRLGCTLVDMKIEFGVTAKGKIVLADVIDSDSWRLWPNGDRRLQLDKQYYRDLTTVTPQDLANLKTNFAKVVEMLGRFVEGPETRIVVLMGSASDKDFGQKIKDVGEGLGIEVILRVTSAHKGTEETLRVIRAYEREAQAIPTVIVAVAGRSNGLGPVTAGNTSLPVISAPPLKADWGREDLWSSVRLPSGLACPLVLGEESAALAAAATLATHDHRLFAKLRTRRLRTQIKLIQDDAQILA